MAAAGNSAYNSTYTSKFNEVKNNYKVYLEQAYDEIYEEVVNDESFREWSYNHIYYYSCLSLGLTGVATNKEFIVDGGSIQIGGKNANINLVANQDVSLSDYIAWMEEYEKAYGEEYTKTMANINSYYGGLERGKVFNGDNGQYLIQINGEDVFYLDHTIPLEPFYNGKPIAIIEKFMRSRWFYKSRLYT